MRQQPVQDRCEGRIAGIDRPKLGDRCLQDRFRILHRRPDLLGDEHTCPPVKRICVRWLPSCLRLSRLRRERVGQYPLDSRTDVIAYAAPARTDAEAGFEGRVSTNHIFGVRDPEMSDSTLRLALSDWEAVTQPRTHFPKRTGQ
jgi:hypothetical protein